jgi:UPF0716 protein FxsA
MWLFVLFIAIPLIEIALFIQVGGFLGLWPTLAIVVLTAILGSWLVRSQGLMALSRVKSSFGELRDPTEPLAHGAMILFSGAMLLTPGFFTDAVGFLLLMPPVRKIVFEYFRKRVKVQGFASAGPQRSARPAGPTTIDGEFTEAPPETPPSQKPSEWTKH